MSTNELTEKIRTLRELRAGEYKVTWKPVTASWLDAAALRAALPEVAARFTRTSMTRRFTVA